MPRIRKALVKSDNWIAASRETLRFVSKHSSALGIVGRFFIQKRVRPLSHRSMNLHTCHCDKVTRDKSHFEMYSPSTKFLRVPRSFFQNEKIISVRARQNFRCLEPTLSFLFVLSSDKGNRESMHLIKQGTKDVDFNEFDSQIK